MERKISKAKVFAATATLLVGVSTVFVIALYDANGSLKSMLNDAKINNEQLLSEKLNVEKELNGTMQSLDLLKGQNDVLDNKILNLQSELSKKQAELNRLSYNHNKTKSLENDLAEVTRIKNELQKQLADFNLQIAGMENDLKKLQNENSGLHSDLTHLQKENAELHSNIALMRSIAADNFMVENLKGSKNRLTVKANKTNRMQVSFVLPADEYSTLTFNITSPDGTQVNSKTDKRISMSVQQAEIYASNGMHAEAFSKNQLVQMFYEPDKKLKAGTYRVEVFNNDIFIGSCKVRLK